MRQRTTFYHYNEDAIERSSLKIEMEGRSLAGPDIKAVREDKFTIGLEELPSELQQLLRDSHELHIRWSPAAVYDTMGPWSSRLPPGLHVFYTPQKDDGTADSGDPLCAFLSSAVNLKNCSESLVRRLTTPKGQYSALHLCSLWYRNSSRGYPTTDSPTPPPTRPTFRWNV